MTIKILNPKVVPELKYENVYILKFETTQPKSQQQKFRLEYEYILYALKEDGTKVFDEKSLRKDVIEDFEETIEKIINEVDRIELAGALTGIEQAFATLIKIRQGVEDTTIVSN